MHDLKDLMRSFCWLCLLYELSNESCFADTINKTSIEDLLEESRLREDATVDVNLQGPIKFSVWVSFMEIYNDQIFDLLEPPPKKKNMRRNVLQLKEDKNGVPYVRGMFVR